MNLIRPIITEKSIADTAAKKFTFKVKSLATKTEIKKEVEKTFGVKVLSVHTTNVHGKQYRTGKKWLTNKKSDWKKAIVGIKKDQNIDLFEVTQTEK